LECVVGLHALIIGGLNLFIGYILEYIGGLHSLIMGGLNIFIGSVLEYFRKASRPGYNRGKYFCDTL
jgi:hypothetical protein